MNSSASILTEGGGSLMLILRSPTIGN
jgi:hypothetical protein